MYSSFSRRVIVLGAVLASAAAAGGVAKAQTNPGNPGSGSTGSSPVTASATAGSCVGTIDAPDGLTAGASVTVIGASPYYNYSISTEDINVVASVFIALFG